MFFMSEIYELVIRPGWNLIIIEDFLTYNLMVCYQFLLVSSNVVSHGLEVFNLRIQTYCSVLEQFRDVFVQYLTILI